MSTGYGKAKARLRAALRERAGQATGRPVEGEAYDPVQWNRKPA
jgi:hypothetical protein